MSVRIPSKPASSRSTKPAPSSKGKSAPQSAAQRAAEKFKKDELSLGRGKRLADALSGIGKKKPDLGRLLHNGTAARNVAEAVRDVLKLVRFGHPLPASESPRVGKGGQMVAPNGDPLLRVKLDDGGGVLGAGQYALVNPKTNEFYLQTDSGGFNPQTTFHGPLSLPPKARFEGDRFTPGELNRLEKLANEGPPAPKLPSTAQLEKAFQAAKLRGELDFGQPAPDPSNVAAEIPLKSQHPFTYYAVVLKDDPSKVIIKQVLTGGFVPAKPGDGSYSQPIPLESVSWK